MPTFLLTICKQKSRHWRLRDSRRHLLITTGISQCTITYIEPFLSTWKKTLYDKTVDSSQFDTELLTYIILLRQNDVNRTTANGFEFGFGASTKLYCLVTEARVYEQLVPEHESGIAGNPMPSTSEFLWQRQTVCVVRGGRNFREETLMKARFPLAELTAWVNGPSWRVTGFHYPSTRAVLTARVGG